MKYPKIKGTEIQMRKGGVAVRVVTASGKESARLAHNAWEREPGMRDFSAVAGRSGHSC